MRECVFENFEIMKFWIILPFVNCLRVNKIEPAILTEPDGRIKLFGDFGDHFGGEIIFTNEKNVSYFCNDQNWNNSVVECNVNFGDLAFGIFRVRPLTGRVENYTTCRIFR